MVRSNLCPKHQQLYFPYILAIELACGEYGQDKVDIMVKAAQNGASLAYFDRPDLLPCLQTLREKNELDEDDVLKDNSKLEKTSAFNQLKVLLKRGFLKSKRDSVRHYSTLKCIKYNSFQLQTLTYLRIGVNVIVGLMLGTLYWQCGKQGHKVLDNYNLLFSILMHHMMSTMMLTILTCKLHNFFKQLNLIVPVFQFPTKCQF